MKKLLFLHIGKTGGVTIRHLLAQQYSSDRIMPVPVQMKQSFRYPTEIIDNIYDYHQNFDGAEVTERYDLVMGHLDWGIAQKLPDFEVMTVLRNPVTRLISQYYQYLGHPSNVSSWGDPVLESGIMRDVHSLKDFYTHPIVQETYNDYQYKILTGLQYSKTMREDPENILGLIKYLGVQERLNRFIENIVTIAPNTIHLNKTAKSNVIDEQDRLNIQALNRLDMILWLKANK